MSGERGFALIAILSLAALVAAFLIASAINLTSAGVSNEREQRSANALRQAKAALIAYAASEQWQKYKGQPSDQPGGLPCPDLDDDGSSEGATCSTALSRIGRLPWATIGAEDLRDASGERLWYAVSSNFRRLSGTTVINSDTPGLLAVTGKAPASDVVAVVIAPGEVVSGQDRILQHNNHLAYLEGVTLDSPVAGDSTFSTVGLPTSAANDRLVVITQSDLMAAVEPVVAARIARDINPPYRTTPLSGAAIRLRRRGRVGPPQDE
jgi:type II secretory pathway pseudopilin PulG